MRLGHIRDKRELNEVFQERLQAAHRDLAAFGQLEQERNLPKTYLLEFHPRGPVDDSGWLTCLRHILVERRIPAVQARETDDPSLIHIAVTRGQERPITSEFAVDAFDPRFLLLHTLETSSEAEPAIDRLVQLEPSFDRAWFHSRFLRSLMEGSFAVEGWRAWYRDDTPGATTPGASTIPPKLVFEENGNLGGGYEEFCRSAYGRKMSLETVLLRSETTNGDFARARIKGNGRITAHGNDFLAFLNVVIDVHERYARAVRAIEKACRLRATERSYGVGLEGQALSVAVRRPIGDLEGFFEGICGGSEPYRLLGLAQRLTDRMLRGRVLDLHVFEPFTLEVASDFLRVFLPEKTCGNTVVRLLTLLEHHYDPRAEVLNDLADAA